MTDETSTPPLERWMESLNTDSNTAGTILLGLTKNDTIVSTRALWKDDGASLVVKPDGHSSRNDSSNLRYRYTPTNDDTGSNGGEGVIQTWKRFTFSVETLHQRNGNQDGTSLTGENYQIHVEVQVTDKETPFPLPTEKEFEILIDFLRNPPEYIGPIKAERVVGLETQKQKIERFLIDRNEEWGLKPDTGIILEGPPGTGKTELAIEVCEEQFGEVPVVISGPEILSRWVGESERILREKFEEAEKREHPVIFIDELDAIARSRSDVTQDHSAQIVAQLLVLLDGINAKLQLTNQVGNQDHQSKPVKVIASTNLAKVVDPALKRPGRLGSQPIIFQKPTKVEKTAILHHYLEIIRRNEKLGDSLIPFVRHGLNGNSPVTIDGFEGLTGADIENLIQVAVENAQTDTESALLEWEHITAAQAELADLPTDPSKITDKQKSNLQNQTLLFANPTGNNEVTSEIKALKQEYENWIDQPVYWSVIDTSQILETEEGDFGMKLQTEQDNAGNKPLFLYLQNTTELLELASQGIPVAKKAVEAINSELLTWDSEDVLFLLSKPGIMDELFLPSMYARL